MLAIISAVSGVIMFLCVMFWAVRAIEREWDRKRLEQARRANLKLAQEHHKGNS